LVCVAGVALVLLSKHGLAGTEGATMFGCFLVAAAAARVCAAPTFTTDADSVPPTSVP
jgi:hypothetical protein